MAHVEPQALMPNRGAAATGGACAAGRATAAAVPGVRAPRPGEAHRGPRCAGGRQLEAAAGAGVEVEVEVDEPESDDLLSPDFDDEAADVPDVEVEEDERLSVR